MSEINFPKGLMVKQPRQGAPEFVKGSISVKSAEFIEYLKGMKDEWVNFDIKVSKDGKWYCALNDWKPTNTGGGVHQQSKPNLASSNDDLPF